MRVNEPGVSRQGWNGEQGAPASLKPPVPSLSVQTPSHNDAEKGGKKSVFRHFFAGISWIQILAGGLAAVTVFLLSSKLGLAGTIIGAALASMISTFASQLYQNILKVANSKLLSTSADDSQQSRSPHESSTAVQPSSTQPSSACASDVPESSQAHRRIVGTSDQSQLSSTTVMPLSQALQGTSSPDYQPDIAVQSADNLKKNKQKKLAIIISVVVALLSVALVTGGIMLITGGKPTDTVLPSTRVQRSHTPTQNSQDDSSQRGEETGNQKERSQSGSDEEKKDENQSSSGSSQDDGSTNSTTNGSDSSQSSNTNESQSSTNSGSSSDSSSSSNSGSSNSDANSSNSSTNSGNSSNSDSSTGSSSDANSQGSNDSSSQSGSAGDSSSRTQK